MSASIERVERWFASRGWRIFDFQREAWRAYAAGDSGLIHAPTGSGKSLAAWLGPVLDWMERAGDAENAAPPIQVLWVTPLRALAADTEANLKLPLDALGLPWRVESRTGDTGQAARARQRRQLPSALVTTPESLSLMLSYPEWARQLRTLRCVVVDEWHELLGSKRGVLLELALARLRARLPALRTWGLSATLGNLEQAMQVLLGQGDRGRLVHGPRAEHPRVRSVMPPTIERFPWAGHLGTQLVASVIDALAQARTTLLFTNTRSQAEQWYRAIVGERPEWVGEIALHHGSLHRGLREVAEIGLRLGTLRCVVATSSLDLGVDFSPVDQVLQVGSPKGVARLMQRAGRSGHRPGERSDVLCVPTHALELLEVAAARRSIAGGAVEARAPLTLCLDVLAQHVVTAALGGGARAAELLAEVRGTHAFAALGEAQWRWVLDFVTRGGTALNAYPQYHRVVDEDGVLRVRDRRIAMRHRMHVGTITSDAALRVRWLRGGTLGHVEESFVARLKPGERFVFAGRLLELVRVSDMTAYVRSGKGGAMVPRWQGGRMPLSTRLGSGLRDLLAQAADGHYVEPETVALRPLLELQARVSRLPRGGELLVECVSSREGLHWFFYPFAGRLVHEGLSALVAWRLSQLQPATFSFSVSDYGFELLSPNRLELDETALRRALCADNLLPDMLEAINAAELARRQFRDIARIAGLVFQGYPGQGKSVRQVQASSGLIFDVLRRHDAGNLLLDQAMREMLEAQFEVRRLRACLERLARERMVLMSPRRLTPLAFPLWAERQQARLSTENWRERVLRMVERLERGAAGA